MLDTWLVCIRFRVPELFPRNRTTKKRLSQVVFLSSLTQKVILCGLDRDRPAISKIYLCDRGFVKKCPIMETAVRNYFSLLFSR